MQNPPFWSEQHLFITTVNVYWRKDEDTYFFYCSYYILYVFYFLQPFNIYNLQLFIPIFYFFLFFKALIGPQRR